MRLYFILNVAGVIMYVMCTKHEFLVIQNKEAFFSNLFVVCRMRALMVEFVNLHTVIKTKQKKSSLSGSKHNILLFLIHLKIIFTHVY